MSAFKRKHFIKRGLWKEFAVGSLSSLNICFLEVKQSDCWEIFAFALAAIAASTDVVDCKSGGVTVLNAGNCL